ncbi:TonB-dependent receptor [Mucilaginibacter limnophilus]|uniref:TonB-dependent receptor n=1 Tax=Mucilaginibacter limnophilus TaxID=1932778 RepID=A0A437MST5_9SPHI|nr:TonB-dependent receptor [Mucilaginibacter limnophilus]RVU00724.1 TonB-dependent receptor [Mucilaginibacter limnophilus]
MLFFYFQSLLTKFNKQAVVLAAVVMLPLCVLGSAGENFGAAFFQANGRIAGSVVDEKGVSFPGATVKIVGQTTGAQTSIDGTFSFSMKPGTYVVEISFISYETKRITDVVVKAGEVTSLNIALKPQTNNLKEVVITSSYNKSSTEGLYSKQKNSATITNGISAEQIAKTPDVNVGQSLKRISGLSTFDNKYVIVRGISERYNVATLDGTPLPSTDYSRRNFSFDLIPSEMIEGVTVVKTVTPDLPVGFAGGLVQVNTRDIPTKNFVNFSVGTGINDQSTGKDFLSTKRGKYDYWGFDDGTRKMAGYFRVTDGNASSGNNAEFTEQDFAFSRQFTNNWNLYRYKANPNRNYTLSLGQSYNLKNPSERIGFIASVNYRNTQTITEILNKRDLFLITPEQNTAFDQARVPAGSGKVYNFNTTFGGILNLGYRSKKNQISLRNSYSRIFSNPLTDVFGYDNDRGGVFIGPQYAPSTERIVTEPDFLSLLQNKLQGEHQLGTVKVNWDISRTTIDRQRKDMLRRQLENDNQQYGSYFHDIVDADGATVFPASRQTFNLKQTDYNWMTSASRYIIKEGDFANILKIGYIGFSKKQENSFITAYLRPTTAAAAAEFNSSKFQLEDVYNDELFGPGKLVYQVDPFGLNEYQGTSKFHAGYAMLDQKFWGRLRFIGGLRVEYFKLFLIDDAISSVNSLFQPGVKLVPSERDRDKEWQFLPSANLTYSLTDEINLRAAYSQSMVRPEFNERSLSSNFNADLQADVTGSIVVSTKTSSYDFRAEWFPGSGEVLSVGAFYKYLDRPLELVRQNAQALYIYNNSNWAKSYGLEAEVRKKLGFINDDLPILQQFTVFSNVTFLRSKVEAVYSPRAVQIDPENDPLLYQLQYETDRQTRPLYGQTPFLLNAGFEYNGEIFGLNIVHNHSGRKFFILTNNISLNEYEAPYDQTDIQLNANVFRKKGKIRFNLGNLFNNVNFFYNSQNSYDYIDPADPTKGQALRPGFTDNYEKGDFITFRRKYGRTFTMSFSYTF